MHVLLHFSRVVFVLACLFVAAFAFAKPDRPTDKKADKMPDMSAWNGMTNWGVFEAKGNRVTFRGHAHWEADGVIRKRDGKWEMFLVWQLVADGRRAPGIYPLGRDPITGHWNYGDACEELPDGSFKGLDAVDSIFKVMPQID